MKKIFCNLLFVTLLALCAAPSAYADDRHRVVRKSAMEQKAEDNANKVIVDGDTISMILPQKNYGRYDRGLFNYLYIPKGNWSYGLSASYSSLDTEDIQVFDALSDFDFNGETLSVRPTVAYFFDHNQSIGVRFVYTLGRADLGSMKVDIDDDMNFNLHDVSYHSHSFQVGAFYRNYVGLDMSKRFAVFNEVALDFGGGTSRFKRYYDDELYNTRTESTIANLTFSPGLCAFIQNNVAFNISFGVFGVKYKHEKQETNGVDEGSRTSSGANFRFNIFNINLGLLVVI